MCVRVCMRGGRGVVRVCMCDCVEKSKSYSAIQICAVVKVCVCLWSVQSVSCGGASYM